MNRNLVKRLEKIARELNNSGIVIRFCDPDGLYPEAEEDKQKGNIVIGVMAEGIKGVQLKAWAE